MLSTKFQTRIETSCREFWGASTWLQAKLEIILGWSRCPGFQWQNQAI
jgi:hypothetical protein